MARTWAVLIITTVLFALMGCGGGEESVESAASCSSTDPSGKVSDLNGLQGPIECDQASGIATAYLADEDLEEGWSCGPYPGGRDAIQCFEGGCEAAADDQTVEAAAFFADLPDGASEKSFDLSRNCP
jgi:hypothetical protein